MRVIWIRIGLCSRVACCMLVTSFYGALKSDLSCLFSFFSPFRESRYSHDCETFGGLVYRTVERAILAVFVFCLLFTNTGCLLYTILE
jgi:hypothetical protein